MNSQGKGSTSEAVTGLDYAIHEHAKVVNCSFGSSSKSSALEDAVKSAESAGVLLVVAAGNDSQSIETSPEYPASYTEGNYSEIRSAIKASVVLDAALAGKTVTGGLLNLDRALQQGG
jgi:subtilisin family serine protease